MARFVTCHWQANSDRRLNDEDMYRNSHLNPLDPSGAEAI